MQGTKVAIIAVSMMTVGGSEAWAQDVRLGYAIQVHQANMMLIEGAASEMGVDIAMAPMRRYADLQLGLMTNELDMVVVGYPN